MKLLFFSITFLISFAHASSSEQKCLTATSFDQLKNRVMKLGKKEKREGYSLMNYTLDKYKLSYRKHPNMETIAVASKEGPFFWLVRDGSGLSQSMKSYPAHIARKMEQKVSAHRCKLEAILRN